MYLSELVINNFRGIDHLELNFNPNINIIIGENGSCKSAVIDAIRLLYDRGNPTRNISVFKEDFHEKIITEDTGTEIEKADKIKIEYIFEGLSDHQKGAFYEYMVIDPEKEYARIEIRYEDTEKKYPQFSYNTGNIEGQKADYNTFDLFQHYYLDALRDSTKDLLSTRDNVLGNVIQRLVKRSGSEEQIEEIIKEANNKLLERDEVLATRNNINENLKNIFKNYTDNQVGLQIEQSKAEYIVNAIKPYLPHDRETLGDDGFNLWQNSLGFNNLIYIATVLGDINEQIEDDKIPQYSLLIEEPEAHLHPQLQLNLYNFLKGANKSDNSQLFITTHSPTLTSKVPFENLILLEERAYRISNVFENREQEQIIRNGNALTNSDFEYRKKQLERYIDVTKSQLFYARSVLFVEGISEELLIQSLTLIDDYKLEDHRIELVNVSGTSFYPFLHLFNSVNQPQKIPKKVTVITDDDRFTDSKKSEYSFSNLIENNYQKLNELHQKLQNGSPVARIDNLNSISNNSSNILIKSAFKTLEYELVFNNVGENKKEVLDNFLIKYILNIDSNKHQKVSEYLETLPNDLSLEERHKVSCLIWKCMPSKADFSQNFSIYLRENLEEAKKTFNIPSYIKKGLDNLIS